MKFIVKKTFFTLLELLIVLFIISFGAILTGVKIKEAYAEQRFLSESQQILNHLAMAQDLMLIMDADIQVKLDYEPQSKRVMCWLDAEKALEDAWAKIVERKLYFSAVRSFQFEENPASPLALQFSLGRMSKGTLVLFEGTQDNSNSLEKRQFKIELVGYPSPLGAKLTETKEQDKIEKSQMIYPAEVYEELYANPSKKNQTP